MSAGQFFNPFFNLENLFIYIARKYVYTNRKVYLLYIYRYIGKLKYRIVYNNVIDIHFMHDYNTQTTQ